MSSIIPCGAISVLHTGAEHEFLGMVLWPNRKLSSVTAGMKFPDAAPPARRVVNMEKQGLNRQNAKYLWKISVLKRE